MTGAAIVRWREGDAVVLAVHGAFDGATAWALRLEMDAARERLFVVDLTQAVEAFDFAASLLATWSRQRWREKAVRFRPGDPGQARLLAGHGLELVPDDALGDGSYERELADELEAQGARPGTGPAAPADAVA